MTMRRILLAATGMTPQTVTETLYVLCMRRDPPWLPHEIHLITTSEGAKDARARLFGTPACPGAFLRFLEDYALAGAGIRFSPEQIHVIRRADGTELDDVRTGKDNEVAADRIAEFISQHCVTGSQVHFSAAGGRKTMDIYSALALSIFGRHGDELSHVLVSRKFDGARDFYYPTPNEKWIDDREGRPQDASKAEVDLALIPFVAMGTGADKAIKEGRFKFSKAVAWQNRFLGTSAELRLHRVAKRLVVICSGEAIELEPAQGTLLLLLAKRRKEGRRGACRDNGTAHSLKRQESLEDGAEYIELHRRLVGEMGRIPSRIELTELLQTSWLDPTISKIGAKLVGKLGTLGAAVYSASTEDGYVGLYGLLPEQITIEI